MMGEIASRLSDYAVVTNDNPRSEDPEKIIGEITSVMKSGFTVIMDREDAIRDALHQAEPGDVVIIAGKGHERGQIFSDHTIDFSDSEVARTILNGEAR
jgi:UDP-N-acetylmuramoyl-L-alanyl-D-glutamate--2,6-diaminopimelate ligase